MHTKRSTQQNPKVIPRQGVQQDLSNQSLNHFLLPLLHLAILGPHKNHSTHCTMFCLS